MVSAYPPVLLDVALVVDDGVPAAERAGGAARRRRRAAGVRCGCSTSTPATQARRGLTSLAFALRLRAPDRTLTGDEATAARDAAVAAPAAERTRRTAIRALTPADRQTTRLV